MKINDLSKELGVTNKEVIDLLKANGFAVSSHLQNATDEMIAKAKEKFVVVEKDAVVSEKPKKVEKKIVETVPTKTYMPDEMIPCKSVVSWKMVETGADRNSSTVYIWNGFGDIEYVSYRDLQYLKRKDVIKDGNIVIEDPDLCKMWARDLTGVCEKLLGVEYPEELFDMPDSEFEDTLQKASDTYKDVIKSTAMDMINAQNYPSVQKLTIIDSVLGTCIKEFL